MNYMHQVAEILGIEFEKEFNLCYQGELIKCKLTPYGIEYYEEDDAEWVSSYGLLGEILTGMCEIKKIWKPKKDEKYFIPNTSDGEAWFTECYWGDSYEGKQRYKTGMVCKTKEKAIEKAQFMLDALKEYSND